MAGEVIAFSDLADVLTTLSSELGTAINRGVNFQLLADSKSFFDVIFTSVRASGKKRCWT